MTWGFLWLMVALKIPIAALIYLVWWAVKQEPEDTVVVQRRRRRRQAPIAATRAGRSRAIRAAGPHGDPAPLPPARVRTVKARRALAGSLIRPRWHASRHE